MPLITVYLKSVFEWYKMLKEGKEAIKYKLLDHPLPTNH